MAYWRIGVPGGLDPENMDLLREIPGTKVTPGGIAVPEHGAALVVETLNALSIAHTIGRPAPRPRRDARLAKPWLREWVPAFFTPYQREGVMAVLNMQQESGFFVWSAGSGKTLGGITWALCAGPAITIVVTKAAIRGTWVREIDTYTQNCYVEVLDGMKPRALVGLPPGRPAFLITSYDTLPAWIDRIEDLKVRSVVFDESHRAKSHARWNATVSRGRGGGEQCTPAGESPAPAEGSGIVPAPEPPVEFSLKENQTAACYRLSRLARRRLATTATPISDRVRDLWAQLDLVHPWEWGSFYVWARRYCLPAEAPIWMGDFTHKPISEVRVGDEVIGWTNREPTDNAIRKKPDASYRQSRLVRTRVVATNTYPLAPIIRVTTDAGRVLRCTPDHRWLRGGNFTAIDHQYAFVTAKVGRKLAFLADPTTPKLTPEQERAAGWIAGMYDGEGCRNFIAQSSRHNPETFAELHRALDVLGIPHTMSEDTPTRGAGGAYITGGREGLLHFFQITRPLRFARSAAPAILTGGPRKHREQIVRIEADSPARVFTLTTETGNYVAYGFASKNCAASENPFGGIDTRGKSNLEELQRRLSFVVHRVPFSVANRALPPKRRIVTYVKVSEQVRAEGIANEIKSAMRGVKSGAEGRARLLEVRLMEAASRKRKIVVAHVADAVAGKLKVCVFTGRRKDVERLREDITKAVPDGTLVLSGDGGTPLGESLHPAPGTRYGMLDAYMKSEGPAVLIGTGDAWGEGLNMQDTDLAILAMLPYTPRQIIQWEGRWARLGQKRPVLIRYLICEGTVDEHVAAILLHKLPAVEQATKSDEIAGLGRELIGASEEELLGSLLAKVLEKKEEPEEEIAS